MPEETGRGAAKAAKAVKEAKEPADPRDAWLWVPDDLSAEDVPLASGVSISAPRMVACGAAVV